MKIDFASGLYAHLDIVEARVGEDTFPPALILDVLRQHDYVTVAVAYSVELPQRFKPYPLGTSGKGELHRLNEWEAYYCRIGGVECVFVPEKTYVRGPYELVARGLFFLASTYDLLREQPTKMWFVVNTPDEMLASVEVYLASDFSVFTSDGWHDRQGVHNRTRYYPRYIDAYNYAASIYEHEIAVLVNRLGIARIEYSQFSTTHRTGIPVSLL